VEKMTKKYTTGKEEFPEIHKTGRMIMKMCIHDGVAELGMSSSSKASRTKAQEEGKSED
jgi:hypothetical protein